MVGGRAERCVPFLRKNKKYVKALLARQLSDSEGPAQPVGRASGGGAPALVEARRVHEERLAKQREAALLA